MAHFGDLSIDEAVSSDGDGIADVKKHPAGTLPAALSLLRVLNIERPYSGEVLLLWQAVAGKSYRVKSKNDQSDAAWQQLGPAVEASDTTASLLLNLDEGEKVQRRFNRMLQVH